MHPLPDLDTYAKHLPDLDAYAKHLPNTCFSHLPRTDDCTIAVVRIDNAQASA